MNTSTAPLGGYTRSDGSIYGVDTSNDTQSSNPSIQLNWKAYLGLVLVWIVAAFIMFNHIAK